MQIKDSKVLVIGGSGFIGSFVVTELLKEDVAEVVIYDNFARGKKDYLVEQLKDPRCSIFPIGGDIRDIDNVKSPLRVNTIKNMAPIVMNIGGVKDFKSK